MPGGGVISTDIAPAVATPVGAINRGGGCTKLSCVVVEHADSKSVITKKKNAVIYGFIVKIM
ncbi:hypothetical protein PE36_17430 [Moritella sp. PE36]|nr:hypothetical protein PE36_17430 [Moritella sp. PE36]